MKQREKLILSLILLTVGLKSLKLRDILKRLKQQIIKQINSYKTIVSYCLKCRFKK